MSARNVQQPIVAIDCDHPGGCAARYRNRINPDSYVYSARLGAQRAGWTVRPARGKGSRNGPDLCPDHKGAS